MLPLEDRAPLSGLPRDLIAKTGEANALTYRRAYHLAVDGALPEVELIGGRWFYRRSGLDKIAAMLGLRLLENTSLPKVGPARKSSTQSITA